MHQVRLKYSILEPRILFAADQATDADGTGGQTPTGGNDVHLTDTEPVASQSAPAPESHHNEVEVVTAEGANPLDEATATRVTEAAMASQQLVREFLSSADGAKLLDDIFGGSGVETADGALLPASRAAGTMLIRSEAQSLISRVALWLTGLFRREARIG